MIIKQLINELALNPSEQNLEIITHLETLLARISVLEANLMSVVLAYRRDLMREMRSGFNEDEFDLMVDRLLGKE